MDYEVLADPDCTLSRTYTALPFPPFTPIVPWHSVIRTDWVVALTNGILNFPNIYTVFEDLFDPQPQVNPTSLTFGEVEVGQTAELTFVLDNAGTGVLDLLNITSTSTAFSASPTEDSVFSVDDSLIVTVEFSPGQEGSYEDTLTLQTVSGNLTLPVSGTATAAGVEPNSALPNEFAVACYPNPFNAELTVQLTLNRNQAIEANLYTVSGEKIGSFYQGDLASGIHELRWGSEAAPSGIYLLKVAGANWTEVRKVVLVR